MKPIRVLLVDDEPSVLRGLRMLLGLEPDISVVGEAADGPTAVDLASRLSPQVVLMDVNLPVVDGITATRQLAARVPQAAVVILSLHDDQGTIDRALAAGAFAFVGKQQIDGDLLGAIRTAAERRKEGHWTRPQTNPRKPWGKEARTTIANSIEAKGEDDVRLKG
jgi:DNA-binding NarL/FixJ family response regulator